MIPILFPAAETAFTDERRQLSECVSCTVREAEGGYSELTLQYPVIGEWFGDLVRDALILAKPDPYTRPQPFRIYAASKPMNGLVRFSARHLVYDGRGIPVDPFTASSAADAAQKLKSNAVIACPFTLTTDLSVAKEWKVETPRTLRELIATDEESWRSVYGGELQFDFYTIRLLQNPGQDRGVTIAYGVDLVDLQQEENIGNTYTGVLPFWSGTQTVTVPSGDPNTEDEVTQQEVCIRGSVRYASGSFPVQKILPVDFSSWFDEPPTATQLDALGDEYIVAKGVGIPEVSLKADYAQIGQDVRLYDTIGVRFERLGVETRARVTGTTFDTLREIYTAVEVGTRPQITDTMTDASRLKTGKLRSSRIANGSIGGRALGSGAVSARALAAYAVTKNKLAALSVGSSKLAAKSVKEEKLDDEAVTTPKVRGHAITYDLLSLAVQQLFVDVLEANRIFGGHITADNYLTAPVVIAGREIIVNSHSFAPGQVTVIYNDSQYSYSESARYLKVNVYDPTETTVIGKVSVPVYNGSITKSDVTRNGHFYGLVSMGDDE